MRSIWNLNAFKNTNALEIARKVEDIFAQGWVGGVCQRRAALQVLLRDELDKVFVAFEEA